MSQKNRTDVLGIPLDETSEEDVINIFKKRLHSSENKTLHLSTVNTEFIMLAQEDHEFKDILNKTDLNVPDGIGVVWAMKRNDSKVEDRVTGVDLMQKTCELAAKENKSIFLLGAAPGVAEKTGQILEEKYPGIKITGSYAGSPKEEEAAHIVSMINESKADILFIAFSAPAPDKWLYKHQGELNTKIAFGVGGSFDFIAGITKRAPKFFQKSGLEWLYRLLQEPKRIKRQLSIPKFIAKIYRSS